jgi:hypothetical protein
MGKNPLDRNATFQLSPEDLFALIDDWLNSMSNGGSKHEDLFTQALMNTHRTLQASFVRFVFHVLLKYGERTEYFDPRNEDAVKLCKELGKMVERQDLNSYIRFI